jgi:YfiH family protein
MNTVEHAVTGGSLPLLQSSLLRGFAHGFSTREGGVSAGPYASLNVGLRWGDSRDNVLENRRRIAQATGATRLCLVRQVHGAGVLHVGPATTPEALAAAEVDAICTDLPGVGVGVFTADCVPLLVGDPITGAVAAIHAGWRGVVAGVAAAAVAQLVHAGSRPADLRVALGPAIGPCCFQVGDEVVAAFDAQLPAARAAGAILAASPGDGRAKSHIDLKRALGVQLEAAGVLPKHIDAGPECTMCDPAKRFYSYRRDHTETGQHLAVIVAGVPGAGSPRP